MKPVAHKLLGEPNRNLSSTRELRYGSKGSLSIDLQKGTFFDHETNEGGGVLDLICRERRLSKSEAADYLKTELGIALDRTAKPKPEIVTTYDYNDQNGELVFQAVRYSDKSFKQRRPNANGGWVWSIKGLERVPYRLPEIVAAVAQGKPILIVEGEKDADRLASLGFPATTCPMGAGKWPKTFGRYFEGASVILIPDNDRPGLEHICDVAEKLKDSADSIAWVELEGVEEKGDISDWLDAGRNAEDVQALLKGARDADSLLRDPRPDDGKTISLADLYSMDFAPIRYVVPGYIAEGLTILAGKPKIGKSWLALDLAVAVGQGGAALGSVDLERGAVLYLALEDNLRRLQTRLKTMMPAGNVPANVHVITESPRLDEGGLDNIKAWLAQNPDAKLVVIDTLAKVRSSRSEKETHYEADYRAVSELQRLAGDRGIAIVLVHHVRKMPADDPIDTVSGTLGLTGAADSVLVLDRTAQGTTLYGRGRDIEEIETAVRFDKDRCRWEVLGDVSAAHRTEERQQVIDLLQQSAEPMGPTEIAKALGIDPSAVRQLLRRMVQYGEIVKEGRGKYTMGCTIAPDLAVNGVPVQSDSIG